MPILYFVAYLLINITSVNAEVMHGIAMHGASKYKSDFKHLEYADPNAVKTGEIKYAQKGSFDSLNSHIINGTSAKGLQLTYDRLMARVWDEPFALYGLVAEKIDIPEDRSSITFYLRDNAKFHDGHKMDVDDVIFSHKMYKNFGHPVRRRVYSLVNKIDRIDDRIIKFSFGEGYDGETALILSMMPVLPEHAISEADFKSTSLKPFLGSGPYKILEVDNGRRITYERVQDYWAKDLPINIGHYNFDKISYIYYRDNAVALEAFKAGDYDLRREFDTTKWFNSYNGLDGIVKEELEHQRPEQVKSLIFNTRRDLFQDINVRYALNLVFDFEWVNKNLYNGAFKRIDSFFPNSELAARELPNQNELKILNKYQDILPKEVFNQIYQSPNSKNGIRSNMIKAKNLLEASGWIIKDNILVNEDSGVEFKFEILLNSPLQKKLVSSFQNNLKKLGIIANIRVVDSSQFSGRLDEFDYDMVLYKWTNSLSPGNEQMNYWSSGAADRNGSRNYTGLRNKAVDEIADSIARSITRQDLIDRTKALDRILMFGYYTIPLNYLGKDFVAYNSKLKRPKTTPIYGMVQEVWWAAE